jgi:hypothetical protein
MGIAQTGDYRASGIDREQEPKRGYDHAAT